MGDYTVPVPANMFNQQETVGGWGGGTENVRGDAVVYFRRS